MPRKGEARAASPSLAVAPCLQRGGGSGDLVGGAIGVAKVQPDLEVSSPDLAAREMSCAAMPDLMYECRRCGHSVAAERASELGTDGCRQVAQNLVEPVGGSNDCYVLRRQALQRVGDSPGLFWPLRAPVSSAQASRTAWLCGMPGIPPTGISVDAASGNKAARIRPFRPSHA